MLKNNLRAQAYCLVIGLIACCFTYLSSHLDGTITPIILENSYSFTNGERADGFVSFKNGFDMPTNGTVTLNLAPGMIVNGVISGNKSTIVLESNCFLGPNYDFAGDLFISSTSQKGIYARGRREYTTNLKLRLQGNIIFGGTGYTEITFANTAFLDLTNSALTDCMFQNIALTFGNTQALKTSATNVNNLKFSNVNMRFGSAASITIRNPYVTFSGDCIISTVLNLFLTFQGIIKMEEAAQLKLDSLTRVRTKGIEVDKENTRFIIDNSTLDITDPTATNNEIVIGPALTSTTHMQLKVIGNCTLRSTAKNELIFPPSLAVLFTTGSRLAINDDVQLTVY